MGAVSEVLPPERAKALQASGHPAGAWFKADGTPRNSITCVICAEQVDCDDFAVDDHLRMHMATLAGPGPEPMGSFRRGITVGVGIATFFWGLLVAVTSALMVIR